MNAPALFLIILGLPLLETYILLQVGHVIGALPTIGLVIGTAVVGSAMLRRQGVETLGRVRATMGRGEIPAVEMLEGAMLMVAGALLVTPGFVTDTLGFICLIPFLRRLIASLFLARLMRSGKVNMQMRASGGQTGNPSGGRTIEGDYRRRGKQDQN